MSVDSQTRSVVEAVFASFRAHDVEQFRSLLDEEVILMNPSTGDHHAGPDAVVAAVRPVLDAFPDLRPEIENVLVDGHQAAVEVVRRGTHTEPLHLRGTTIPPTNREVELPECLILEVHGEKVTSITAYADRQMIVDQLGLESSNER